MNKISKIIAALLIGAALWGAAAQQLPTAPTLPVLPANPDSPKPRTRIGQQIDEVTRQRVEAEKEKERARIAAIAQFGAAVGKAAAIAAAVQGAQVTAIALIVLYLATRKPD